MSDLPAPREGYVGFSLTGKDLQLWEQLYPKLIVQLEVILVKLAEDDPQTSWLQQQAKELGSLALENIKARLRKEGLENDQIEANIANLYAEREKTLTEARLIRAQASEVEFANMVKRLLLALGLAKAMIVTGEGDEKAIFIGRQIDAMLEAIKAVSEMKSLSQEP